MKNIYIISKCKSISRNSNQIVARTIDGEVSTIPLIKTKNIFIFGNSPVTLPLINYLLSRNIYVFMLTRSGKLKGIISPPLLKSNNNLRLSQYSSFIDDKKKLKIARSFVLKKWDAISEFCNIKDDEMIKKINKVRSIDSLLGIEGGMSLKYFKRFKDNILNTGFNFEKREYHPSPDPVNAMLSFGYTLFYQLMFPFVISSGLDPYIGFLHIKHGSHMALCSDLMEEYRVEIGNLVQSMILNNEITTNDFTKKKNNFIFSGDGIRRFIYKYNQTFSNNENMLKRIETSVKEFTKLL